MGRLLTVLPSRSRTCGPRGRSSSLSLCLVRRKGVLLRSPTRPRQTRLARLGWTRPTWRTSLPGALGVAISCLEGRSPRRQAILSSPSWRPLRTKFNPLFSIILSYTLLVVGFRVPQTTRLLNLRRLTARRTRTLHLHRILRGLGGSFSRLQSCLIGDTNCYPLCCWRRDTQGALFTIGRSIATTNASRRQPRSCRIGPT